MIYLKQWTPKYRNILAHSSCQNKTETPAIMMLLMVNNGQQRLTTLTMILNAVIETLSSDKEKIINEDKFIKSDLGWKLELLGKNSDFFKDLLDGKSVDHTNKSQRLLKEANNHISQEYRYQR